MKWCFVFALIRLCAAFLCVVAYKDVVSLSPDALEEERNMVLETVVVEKLVCLKMSCEQCLSAKNIMFIVSLMFPTKI